MNERQQFIDIVQTAFREGKLLKGTLSRPTPSAAEGLKNIYLRPVEIKKGPRISFNYRYQTRDEVKNYDEAEAGARLLALLESAFRSADLFTAEADYSLRIEADGRAQLTKKKPSHTEAPALQHDRAKQRLIDPAAPWLHALGVTNARGEVLPSAQDKWKQINKYVEVIEALLRQHPLPDQAVIADMGSGKGYLTFALYDFLTHHLGLHPRVTGIELRPKLVDFCNALATRLGYDGLQFLAADIQNYQPERLDMLIALHACDTATDLALAAGIHQNAGIIVAAPCCHKQVRRDMHAHNEMAPLLRHGILEERQAEIVTDGIRALLLEANGYKTQVFEFISTEHTAKNVMITAVQHSRLDEKRRRQALEQVQALKTGFGIGQHYLETLL